MRIILCTFALLCLISGSIGRTGFGPGEQEWDYVTVRPKARMFWWLYFTTAQVKTFYDKPLIIWLQGGPGGSGTSYGNFEEIGPLDINLKPRNYTWVKDYNVLFIDNPIGTGFSYAESNEAFATTNEQIANDLVKCMQGFYNKLPLFRNVSTYITTESYGGKMGAQFARVWYQAQQNGTILSNLKGVALGDAWISPIDSVLTWAPYLLSLGLVDTDGYKAIDVSARKTQELVNIGQWERATEQWGFTQGVIFDQTYNVDFYNILTKRNISELYDYLDMINVKSFSKGMMIKYYLQHLTMSLEDLMNGPVKKALGLDVIHGSQASEVFNQLRTDFMKPVIDEVELLLNQTNLKVYVYNGQLDLIVDTPGTLDWVEKLKWKGANNWKNAIRKPLVYQNGIEGYVKSQDKFSMYWVNRAGHMVPKDNTGAMKVILENFIKED